MGALNVLVRMMTLEPVLTTVKSTALGHVGQLLANATHLVNVFELDNVQHHHLQMEANFVKEDQARLLTVLKEFYPNIVNKFYRLIRIHVSTT
jgi:hypothetical protein